MWDGHLHPSESCPSDEEQEPEGGEGGREGGDVSVREEGNVQG